MLTDLLNAASTFVEWLSTLGTGAVLLFTFLSSAVEMTFLLGLLVPGESVVMLAGSLPAGPAGFALVVAVGTAGALTGQSIGYAVGRVLGDRLRETRLGRRIGPERFDRAAAYLRDRGAPALVAVRFVAVIHAVVPIVAGTARMPFGRFLGWSAVGTTLWVSAFAGVGAATAGADSTGGLGLMLTAIGATCLGAVPLGAKLLRRAFVTRERQQRGVIARPQPQRTEDRGSQAQHLVVVVPADTDRAGGQTRLLHVQRRVQRAFEQRPDGQFGRTHKRRESRVHRSAAGDVRRGRRAARVEGRRPRVRVWSTARPAAVDAFAVGP